jgi:putative FmdB family regulatory protein
VAPAPEQWQASGRADIVGARAKDWWEDMPIYVYHCDCGLRFERLTSRDAEAPQCPECGAATRKVPAGISLGSRAGSAPAKDGRAKDGRVKDGLAPPWQVMAGDPERRRREVEFRQRLAAKDAGDAPSGGAAGAQPTARSGGDAGAPPAAG